jgi:hypothetical protein
MAFALAMEGWDWQGGEGEVSNSQQRNSAYQLNAWAGNITYRRQRPIGERRTNLLDQ